MNTSDYNRAMACVRAALFAERFKRMVYWSTIVFYVWLFAEVIWYYGSVGRELAPPMQLFIGGPILLVIIPLRIIGRLRRGF